MKPISICIFAPSGRMGKQVIQTALRDARFKIVSALGRKGSDKIGQDVGALIGLRDMGVAITDDPKAALANADLAIEFSKADATPMWAMVCAQHKKPLVSGTTGLGNNERAALMECAKTIPIFHANNMSRGVYVAQQLIAQAAKMLNADYAIEIIETHHSKKIDAPSGTAFNFANAAAESRGLTDQNFIYGRHGKTGLRPDNQIAIHTLRGGDVIGEHQVHFLGNQERLEITHRSLNRDLFAGGALDAAHWLSGQKPGLYGMADLLA